MDASRSGFEQWLMTEASPRRAAIYGAVFTSVDTSNFGCWPNGSGCFPWLCRDETTLDLFENYQPDYAAELDGKLILLEVKSLRSSKDGSREHDSQQIADWLRTAVDKHSIDSNQKAWTFVDTLHSSICSLFDSGHDCVRRDESPSPNDSLELQWKRALEWRTIRSWNRAWHSLRGDGRGVSRRRIRWIFSSVAEEVAQSHNCSFVDLLRHIVSRLAEELRRYRSRRCLLSGSRGATTTQEKILSFALRVGNPPPEPRIQFIGKCEILVCGCYHSYGANNGSIWTHARRSGARARSGAWSPAPRCAAGPVAYSVTACCA